jgi:hypothetical protein
VGDFRGVIRLRKASGNFVITSFRYVPVLLLVDMNKFTSVVVQLTEGLFGWIWLLSIPVNFWFFISIFISDGTWSRFFAGAIVAFVSKGLMVGFLNVRRAVAAANGNTDAESLVEEVQKLSPSERESLASHLESIAATKESTELYAKIAETAPTALKAFKGWLTLELVYETFTTLHHSGGVDLDGVVRINRAVMTQAESLQSLVVRWRTLNPEAEERTIDTIKRACESVLTSGHVMKGLIARRRRELNPNAVPTEEDEALLAQIDRCSAYVKANS